MGKFDQAERLKNLPFHLYPTIEKATAEAVEKGRDIIDLSTGEPSFPTPGYIIEELQRACEIPATHRYGNLRGYPPFRESIARWYERRFGIELDPPRGSFYVWFPIPGRRDSLDFVREVILETGVVTFPGIGYGENGEGYIRIAVVQDLPRMQEAFRRLGPFLRS